ncbi:MAG: sigma-70 family RNA polymerase sigma factor [Acidobacteriota bacterium]
MVRQFTDKRLSPDPAEDPAADPEAHRRALHRFEALIGEYGNVIRGAIRKVAGREHGHLVEDLEQQVALELWKQMAREQTIDHPSSYLYRAAVRETIRLVRKLRQRGEEPLDPAEAPPRDEAPNPEQRFAGGEIAGKLDRITAGLANDRRRAVVAHLAGYRVREIMDEYGWTYQRARNLVARGMADLRRALLEERDDG